MCCSLVDRLPCCSRFRRHFELLYAYTVKKNSKNNAWTDEYYIWHTDAKINELLSKVEQQAGPIVNMNAQCLVPE